MLNVIPGGFFLSSSNRTHAYFLSYLQNFDSVGNITLIFEGSQDASAGSDQVTLASLILTSSVIPLPVAPLSCQADRLSSTKCWHLHCFLSMKILHRLYHL